MTERIRVGVLFGGKSAEHEVSIRSARNVVEAIDTKKYEVILMGIDTAGKWHLIEKETLFSAETLESSDDAPVNLIPGGGGRMVVHDLERSDIFVDVVFPILHGTFGEDGTVQGLLKLADIPFVGSGVLGSAVGMDKDVMKRLLRDAKIPVSKFQVFRKNEMPPYDEIIRLLGAPFFIKPANAGSSVGVSKVRSREDFEKAAEEAFQYDQKIIVEEMIEGREIECAILGSDDPIASIPGEIIPHHDFYSYEAKYLDADGASIEIPAKITAEESKRIQELAIRTFQVLCSDGLGRVDIFLREDGAIFVNEINTMPGFTSISMYPKLFEASGISYTDLIDKLIALAFERFEKENALKTKH